MPDPLDRPIPGPDLFRLDGQVAFVTGVGGRGFGQAIAHGLARAGAAVFGIDRDADGAARTAAAVRDDGGTIETMAADVSRPEEIDAAFARLDERFGRVDILVNSAGINPLQGAPEDFPMGVWERVMATNLTGSLLCAKAAGRRMIAAGRGGSVVSISSIAGSTALGRGNLAYGVSKAGLIQMTRELAVAWAHHGIRVNAIQPCQFFDIRQWTDDPALGPAMAARVLSGIPMGRTGRAEEIVGPVLFLASPAASMVTGVTLPVDGGNLALNPGGSLPGR
jgi:NAD(P)-dependent dehydrogenase (short-subunit alcohol dehydrogenase family)